jgi:WD40 repeat protein/tRNA A-37 threonylcarbamoyl transferase component Bud32
MSEARLDELLLRWEELREQGRDVSAEELCRDHPELRETLRRRIDVLRAIGPVLQPTVPDAGPRSGPTESPQVTFPGGRPPPEIPGYEVLGELGRGGMGVVYKARQVKAHRVVALKMILSGAHAGASDLARFSREIETIAGLQHPNLVAVYEVGEHDGRPFYSMEYVEGGNLHDRMKGQPLAPRQAAEIVEVLGRAIHAVHQRGIVHRDLKPGNVLLAGCGLASGEDAKPQAAWVPKITDFGIARKVDSADGMTATGAVLGTPSYMAPEQAAGRNREVGPATDVWALGAILYELLTGRPPFLATTAWDTIHQVMHEDPVPPRDLEPGLPPDLETICLKCLQKPPARRYAGGAELADDLRRFLDGEPIRARPAGPVERGVKWARRRPAVAVLLGVTLIALLVIAGGGVATNVRLRRQAEESRKGLVRLYVEQGDDLLDDGDWSRALVWFTEALRLDQGRPETRTAHRTRIGVTLRQCPRLVRLWVHDGPVSCVGFVPGGGRRVLTAGEDGQARVWDVATGAAAAGPFRHGGAIRSAAFSRDGRLLLTTGDDGAARVWDVASGRPVTPPLRHGRPVPHGEFRPDGARVVTAGEDGTARTWDVAGGGLLQTFRHGGPVGWAAFSPDGRRVLTASDDHTARVWDADGGQCLRTLQHGAEVTTAALSPDGTRLATGCSDHKARVWDPAGGKLLCVLPHFNVIDSVFFSPDGHSVLTASDDHTAGIWDAGTGLARAEPLRHASGLNVARFSADGRLAVTGSDDDSARVWDAADGHPLTPLLRHNGSVNDAAFSPDGRYLVTGGNDRVSRVWELSTVRQDRRDDDRAPAGPAPVQRVTRWTSPDGSRVAVLAADHRVYVEADGVRGPVLVHGSSVKHAAFSPDGRELITASDDDVARVWDWSAGNLLAALRHRGSVLFAAFSPDGRRVVTDCANGTVRAWDAKTGEPLTPPLPYEGACRRAVFSEDGQSLTVFGDGTRQTWDLSPDERPLPELAAWAKLLSGGETDPTRGFLPLEPEALQKIWEELAAQPAPE